MRAEDLDYVLPPARIATAPAEPRDAAKLLVAHRATGEVAHHQVRDLPALGIVRAGDLMVVNRSRVLPAAFEGVRVSTGGRVSGLYLSSDASGQWQVMLEARGKLQPGERIELDEQASLILLASLGRGQWQVRVAGDEASREVEQVLGRVGRPPLPPYIQKARRALGQLAHRPEDVERYNTVYAGQAGSVAAPTAGLHFTPQLLKAMGDAGVALASVTLHVGLGTFMPIRTDELGEHEMHAEWLRVPIETVRAIRDTRARGGRILVVGTTTVRALESLPEAIDALTEDFVTQTQLFIYPGGKVEFRFTDMLMTNFHLPRSTLLAMVAALPDVGLDRLKQWYQAAIDAEYRFYSFGDAMLVV